MKIMKDIKKASLIFLIMTVITGIIYPFTITGFAQIFMQNKANGSIITNKDNEKIGSKYIGQTFTDSKYFWSRPSAVGKGYDTYSSSGTNFSPTGKDYKNLINDRIALLTQYNPDNKEKIPVDLITASGSGLDPHISLAAAKYQISRVSKFTNISEDKLLNLVQKHTDTPFLGIWGEVKVNVLELNLDLDKMI
ncbi:potassium-transporting ATPase subunit KdpC [Romboutsia maritimum]|uniref:Potassium-transporting ATPase KdpC subunit n=1 Tax=Romboutsia maritimum TaxID=2020948 RepID=A0A371IR38_9FIRM|nr:potassium-transporting ATPase subunit KdpC [Romboutsia maritimum]RDY22942.1 potassium-transporting ATPase subunit KdpC [Romboutsia maritimum]